MDRQTYLFIIIILLVVCVYLMIKLNTCRANCNANVENFYVKHSCPPCPSPPPRQECPGQSMLLLPSTWRD